MITRILALGITTLFLVGCNTMAGIGEDVQAGGKKLENAAEKKK